MPTMQTAPSNFGRNKATGATVRQAQNGRNGSTRMPTTAPVGAGDNIMAYVVKDTDTLQDILNQFNMDFEELLTYNSLEDIMLKPGSTINVVMNDNVNR